MCVGPHSKSSQAVCGPEAEGWTSLVELSGLLTADAPSPPAPGCAQSGQHLQLPVLSLLFLHRSFGHLIATGDRAPCAAQAFLQNPTRAPRWLLKIHRLLAQLYPGRSRQLLGSPLLLYWGTQLVNRSECGIIFPAVDRDSCHHAPPQDPGAHTSNPHSPGTRTHRE